MYFARQIQWCDQNPLWTLSLESGRSSMDQEEFLKDDQIYFCKPFSYREVWYINFYLLCKTNLIMWSKLLMDIIIGIKKILHGWGRVLGGWQDLLLQNFELKKIVIYQFVCPLWEKFNGVKKSLIEIILEIRKTIHGWGGVPERWPYLLL